MDGMYHLCLTLRSLSQFPLLESVSETFNLVAIIWQTISISRDMYDNHSDRHITIGNVPLLATIFQLYCIHRLEWLG